MLKTLLFLGLLTAFGSCENFGQYFQTDFLLKTEHFDVVEYNKNYMDNLVFKNFKYNRTSYALNVSAVWQVDLHGPLIVTVQGYKFSSNEYRLFPIYFTFDACDVLEKNSFGLLNVYRCGHFFHCPIKKGPFDFCNWDIDYKQLPPHFPRGRYMLDLKWKYQKINIVNYKWFVEIIDVPLPY